ncbi:MAG: ankyrin repeat domain-containing protein, partial [Cyanobacteria bacterium P01_D01_bin.73]
MNILEQNPLISACQRGKEEVADFLIERGFDINARNLHDQTPLHMACRSGSLSLVKLLVQGGADLNAVSSYGNTPVNLAAISGHDPIVRFLEGKGVTLDPYDNLMVGNIAEFKAKAGRDFNLNLPYPKAPFMGYSLLGIACRNRKEKIVKFLIDEGVDIDCGGNEKGESFLFEAVYREGSLEVLNLLLEAGADPNRRNKFDRTPLHNAARAGESQFLALLIEAGGDVHCLDGQGRTPLFDACQVHNFESVEILVRNGALVNIEDVNGGSPLNLIMQRREGQEIIELLLASDKTPDIQERKDRMLGPINLAAIRG